MNESKPTPRERTGKRGRLPTQPRITGTWNTTRLIPQPFSDADAIFINDAEVEVLRLVDVNDLYQEQAAKEMHVSRGTVWRLLMSARKKVAQSLVEGRRLIIGNEE